MKKNGLFKLIAGTLLLAMILTFAIPGSSGERNYLGIGTAVISIAQTLSYFTDTIVLILLIGGFYGILNKTGAYKKLIDSIVTKYKDNKNFLYLYNRDKGEREPVRKMVTIKKAIKAYLNR